MALRITIVMTKVCPICDAVLNKILYPLANVAPDLIILDIKEGIWDLKSVGFEMLFPAGQYHPFFRRTPEIYIRDKIYLIGSAHPSALLKFYRELSKEVIVELNRSNISPLRRKIIEDTLIKIENTLLEDLEKVKNIKT